MTQSKAAYYDNHGAARDVLKISHFYIPAPEDDEVQIEIMFSGVNPADVKFRAGLREKKSFPTIIPHHDGAGIVTKIGKNVTKFKENDKVWICNGSWRRSHGTACSMINIPEELVTMMPRNIPLEIGACLGIAALTAASSLISVHCQPKDTVMITGGAGSVANMAIQLAKFMGYRVVTTVSSEAKAKIAQQAGADYVINYKVENVLDKVKEYTSKRLLDGLIDVDFGGNIGWSIEALRNHATLVAYASETEPMPVMPFYQLMSKQITIKPTLVYQIDQKLRAQAIELINNALMEKALHPIINKIYSLDQIIEAHEAVEAKDRIGQVLVKMA